MSSHLEVSHVRGESVATRLVSCAPLKFVPTASLSGECRIYTSSYGGGILQGDQINIQIDCRRNASLVLQSQGNQHLYLCNQAPRLATQNIVGTCESGSRVAILPEPTVMHQGSLFKQMQLWNVVADCELILLDGLHVGRSENGESFTYESYQSTVEFRHAGQSVYLDQFSSKPCEGKPNSASRFGNYCLAFNLFSFGEFSNRIHGELALKWDSREANKICELPDSSVAGRQAFFCATLHDSESGITTSRILVQRRQDLDLFLLDLKNKVSEMMSR